MTPLRVESGPAMFSPDRNYRYTLNRHWGPGKSVMWIGLNPSTADEAMLDPTLRRVFGFSRGWGYEGFYMTNLFAFRATIPRVMLHAADPVGPDNDTWLTLTADACDMIVCAWGGHGTHRNRSSDVIDLLSPKHFHKMRSLGLTKSGEPKHPLYLASVTSPIPYPPR